MGRLDELDLTLSLSKDEEIKQVEALQARLTHLRLYLGGHMDTDRLGPPLCIVFEGWDAAGKGGAVKRIVAPLDPRHYQVRSIAKPTEEELRHHFLWRFWLDIPGWGGMVIFDRSWYGRVLVERVEGFATREQWGRAYQEIADFERTLVAEGMILCKFWLHVSDEEQLKRFESRAADPLRAWKMNDEDWRNRAKRAEYEAAVEDMLAKTDQDGARWTLIEAESKRWARVKVLETVINTIEEGLVERGLPVPEPHGK